MIFNAKRCKSKWSRGKEERERKHKIQICEVSRRNFRLIASFQKKSDALTLAEVQMAAFEISRRLAAKPKHLLLVQTHFVSYIANFANRVSNPQYSLSFAKPSTTRQKTCLNLTQPDLNSHQPSSVENIEKIRSLQRRIFLAGFVHRAKMRASSQIVPNPSISNRFTCWRSSFRYRRPNQAGYFFSLAAGLVARQVSPFLVLLAY